MITLARTNISPGPTLPTHPLHTAHLCVEQQQRYHNLSGQGPELMQGQAQVDHAVGVNRHQSLHPACRARPGQ